MLLCVDVRGLKSQDDCTYFVTMVRFKSDNKNATAGNTTEAKIQMYNLVITVDKRLQNMEQIKGIDQIKLLAYFQSYRFLFPFSNCKLEFRDD